MATLIFSGDGFGVEARQVGTMLSAAFRAKGISIETSVLRNEKSSETRLIIGLGQKNR